MGKTQQRKLEYVPDKLKSVLDYIRYSMTKLLKIPMIHLIRIVIDKLII
jgi:hypothetical protein